MPKNQMKRWMLGIMAGLLGSAAFGEAPVATLAAAGWKGRLYLKTAEAFIDAITRAIVAEATAPAAREEYEVLGELSDYQDQVWGWYRGSRLPYRFRHVWADPITGQPHYETYFDSALQDREAFYYAPHNRDYNCTPDTRAGSRTETHVAAAVQYAIRNKVVRADAVNAIAEHPVRWHFDLRILPGDCSDGNWDWAVTQIGNDTLMRGGKLYRSPWLRNVDVVQCYVLYEAK